MSQLTLGQLVSDAVQRSLALLREPTLNAPHLQAQLTQTCTDLQLCEKLADHVGVISPNETLEDVQTRSLKIVLVPYYRGALEALVRTHSTVERSQRISKAQQMLAAFMQTAERLEIVKGGRRDDEGGSASASASAATGLLAQAQSRTSKIERYKAEKALDAQLDLLRKRKRKQRSLRAGKPYDDERSVDPREDWDDAGSDDDSDDDEMERSLILKLIASAYLKAQSEADNLQREQELLSTVMASTDAASVVRSAPADTSWRLDAPPKDSGPLVAPSGRVLRPFTIMPGANDLHRRIKVQSQVLGPDHSLPTMTIDELLEHERETGRIVEAGPDGPGPRNSEEAEQAKRDKAALKEDDTAAGYAADEEHVREARDWDAFTDEHRRGEGNRMNRG